MLIRFNFPIANGNFFSPVCYRNQERFTSLKWMAFEIFQMCWSNYDPVWTWNRPIALWTFILKAISGFDFLFQRATSKGRQWNQLFQLFVKPFVCICLIFKWRSFFLEVWIRLRGRFSRCFWPSNAVWEKYTILMRQDALRFISQNSITECRLTR